MYGKDSTDIKLLTNFSKELTDLLKEINILSNKMFLNSIHLSSSEHNHYKNGLSYYSEFLGHIRDSVDERVKNLTLEDEECMESKKCAY